MDSGQRLLQYGSVQHVAKREVCKPLKKLHTYFMCSNDMALASGEQDEQGSSSTCILPPQQQTNTYFGICF